MDYYRKTKKHFLIKAPLPEKYEKEIFYCETQKIMNTKNNFWNVYCSLTYQAHDETIREKPLITKVINITGCS